MKLINKDIKNGKIIVQVENLDDLWYLNNIIEPGDLISGRTLRKIKSGDSEGRSQNVMRKPVFIEISAEKIEFSKINSSLRILGPITSGPEDVVRGEHHSFSLEENTVITIKKEKFLKYQLDRLKDAEQSGKLKVMILVHDREQATFSLLNSHGYDILLELSGEVSKKEADVNVKKDFYSELIGKIKDYDSRHSLSRIIIASPAFFKDDLMKMISDDILKKKIILAVCNNTGNNGINEVIRRPEVKEALKEGRAAKEALFVDELLHEISVDGKASYGLEDVSKASVAGAVSLLLVADGLLFRKREQGGYEQLESLMKSVESSGGEVHLISVENEAGEKLMGIGGIGAILRYKLNY